MKDNKRCLSNYYMFLYLNMNTRVISDLLAEMKMIDEWCSYLRWFKINLFYCRLKNSIIKVKYIIITILQFWRHVVGSLRSFGRTVWNVEGISHRAQLYFWYSCIFQAENYGQARGASFLVIILPFTKYRIYICNLHVNLQK